MIPSILIMFILFIGSAITPSYIIAEDWKAIIKACIAILISTIIFKIIIDVIMVILIEINTYLILVLFFVEPFVNILALMFASNTVNNFEIRGVWTYIILAFLISAFKFVISIIKPKRTD